MDRPKPNWDMWKHVPYLTAKEAVALTLNIDPLEVQEHSEGVWAYTCPKTGVVITISRFADRIFLFKRCFGRTEKITLSELIFWAKTVKWDMPMELSETDFGLIEHPAPSDNKTNTSTDCSDNERTKLLKHIGCLALVLCEKNKRYNKAETPNANKIAADVQEILDELPDSNRYGAGIASIRASIKEGIDALMKLNP